jgi:hypothetical protein
LIGGTAQPSKATFAKELQCFSQNRLAPAILGPRFSIAPRTPASITLREHKSGLKLAHFIAGCHFGERQG